MNTLVNHSSLQLIEACVLSSTCGSVSLNANKGVLRYVIRHALGASAKKGIF